MDEKLLELLDKVRHVQAQQVEQDEDSLFCLSLVGCLKQVNPCEKVHARLQLHQTLSNIEFAIPTNMSSTQEQPIIG